MADSGDLPRHLLSSVNLRLWAKLGRAWLKMEGVLKGIRQKLQGASSLQYRARFSGIERRWFMQTKWSRPTADPFLIGLS